MARDVIEKEVNLGGDNAMTDIKKGDAEMQPTAMAQENQEQPQAPVADVNDNAQPTITTTTMVSTIANPLKNIVASILSKSAETCEVTPDMCENMYQNRVKSHLLKGIPSNPTNVQQGFSVEKYEGEYYLINNVTFDIDAVQKAVAHLVSGTSYKVYQDGERLLTDVEVQYIQYLSEGKLFMAKTFDSHGELIGYAIRRA